MLPSDAASQLKIGTPRAWQSLPWVTKRRFEFRTGLILNQRPVLPSWAVCQPDGFCRVAVEDGLDLFDHGLHNFMAAGGDPIDGVGG